MVNKILSLMKEGWMKKTAVIFMIAIFMVVCSVGVYAQEITTIDKEKWDKLTPEQKQMVIESAKENQKLSQKAAKEQDAVAEKAEKIVKVLEVVKEIGERAQDALNQTEQNLWKDPNLEKLKAEEKAKQNKENN